MGRIQRLELRDFRGGYNNVKNPTLLGPGEASACTNVDLQDGTLKGHFAPASSSVYSLTSNIKGLHYLDQYGWTGSTAIEYYCDDTVSPGTGYRTTLYTQVFGSASPTQAEGSAIFTLGYDKPGTPTIVNGITGGVRRFRVTAVKARAGLDQATPGTEDTAYYDQGAPFESNPSNYVEVALWDTSDITLPTAVSGAYEWRIYATAVGAEGEGPYYYLDRVAMGTTNYSPSTAPRTPYLLNWEAGGKGSNPVYKFDHTKAGLFTVLAEAMHSYAAGAGQGGAGAPPASGVLFAGKGSTLYWSELGYPWYWPEVNTMRLDAPIEAIIPDQAVTYVFTRRSIYVVTGAPDPTNDEQVSIQRANSQWGCIQLGGKAVVKTPHGIVFPTGGGIALFDGNTARLLTDGIVKSTEFNNNAGWTWSGAFGDDLYILCDGGAHDSWLMDMSAFPAVRFSRLQYLSRLGIRFVLRSNFTANDSPGTYIVDNSDVTNYKARLLDLRPDTTDGTRMAWSWTTGRLDAGMPTRQKSFQRIWVESSGTISITATCGSNDSGGTTIATQTLTGSGWLKDTFIGDWIQLAITSANGTGVLYSVVIEYGAWNG